MLCNSNDDNNHHDYFDEFRIIYKYTSDYIVPSIYISYIPDII